MMLYHISHFELIRYFISLLLRNFTFAKTTQLGRGSAWQKALHSSCGFSGLCTDFPTKLVIPHQCQNYTGLCREPAGWPEPVCTVFQFENSLDEHLSCSGWSIWSSTWKCYSLFKPWDVTKTNQKSSFQKQQTGQAPTAPATYFEPSTAALYN